VGVRLAVDHLIARGRRRIGFINGPPDTTPGHVRGQAFADACRATGLEQPPAHCATAEDFTFDAGARAAAELLGRVGGDLDAVVAANDLIAAGTYHAAVALGLSIPEQLAVVGMDDSALAAQLLPTLTSVDLGSAARGRCAAELLLARLRDPGREVQRVVVEPELVVRRSTATGPDPAVSGLRP
jgi:LacI family transcriptional regulator